MYIELCGRGILMTSSEHKCFRAQVGEPDDSNLQGLERDEFDIMFPKPSIPLRLYYRASIALSNNSISTWLRIMYTTLLGRKLTVVQLPCQRRCSKRGQFGTSGSTPGSRLDGLHRWLETHWAPCDQCLFGGGENVVAARLALAVSRSKFTRREAVR